MIAKTFCFLLVCVLSAALFFPDETEKVLSSLQISTQQWNIQLLAGVGALFFLSLLIQLVRKRKKRIFFNNKTARLPIDLNNKGNVHAPHVVLSSCFMILVLLLLVGPLYAHAATHMVSVAKDGINIRRGPGTKYAVLWELDKGFPLMVLQSKNNWYKVKDFEGDIGWIYKPLTSRTAHVVVKKEMVNIRSRPGTQSPIVAKAYKGVVFTTVSSVKGWVKVRHEKGPTGWIARSLVWGW